MRGTYNTGSQIRFKTTMLKSSLCDYSDAYIVAKGTKTVLNTGTAAAPKNRIKEVVFENCVPFTECVSKINNMQIDNAKDDTSLSFKYKQYNW